MEIFVLANCWGNFDPKGDSRWTWKDGVWLDPADGAQLPPEEFHVTVAECPDCEGSKCTYCGDRLGPGHVTLGDPESPVSYATCGKELCNTLIANMIDPATV